MNDTNDVRSSPPMFGFDVPDHVALVERRGDAPVAEHPAEEAILHPRAVPSRRDDVRRGRAAAHTALRRIGADAGPILRGDHGEPIWPSGVVGAIAHTLGVALAAVARTGECGGLGVDVEHVDRYFAALPETIAFDVERRWLDDLGPADRARSSLEVFSAKESIYKAFFPRVNRFFGFEAVRIARRGPGSLEARFVEAVDPAFNGSTPIPIQCRWAGEMLATLVVLPPYLGEKRFP
ncbi:MAG TPA: 4'-phosphopantetheinyl transferase superfamily protein [Acidimicrobiia bacterium]|nr:4'-phosphopantetheinyl transferase superfamily protein [Acidimicrobiia bacterium]